MVQEEQFQLLRRFQYSSEAIIYQGKLESQGIEVFLRDNHIVDTNPLYSNAVGGVKLFVKNEDVIKANEILQDVSLYSLDDNHKLVKCPNCGAEQTDMVTSIGSIKMLVAYVISVLLLALPFMTRHKYKCAHCKHEFN
jgi:DNA-directed RNA polymerase subunit RPC12/RpoP